MKSLIRILAIFSLASVSRAQVVADLGADFSIATSNGTLWDYGYSSTSNGMLTYFPLKRTAGTFNGIDQWEAGGDGASDTPFIAHNPDASSHSITLFYGGNATPVVAGGIVMHPGPTGPALYSIAEWTVQSTGLYTIASSFINADTNLGATANVDVLLNGSSLSSGPVNTGASFYYNSSPLNLTSGDVIRFAVGNGNGAYFNDSVAVTATITAVPEPAAYAALAGIGALSVAAWRRRKACTA